MKKWLRICGLVALVVGSVALFGQAAKAAQVGARTFVAGELVISVPHGTARAVVDGYAAKVNATVVQGWPSIDFEGTTDAYHLRIAGAAVPDADTLNAVAALKATAGVRYAGLNRYFDKRQVVGVTPNDPRFNEQWDKVMMRMPEAWTLEKGKASVVLCVIDDAIDIDHPEFKDRTLVGFNGFGNNNDPRPPAANVANASHGTHVAGIAIAAANNATGVAGVVWEGVMLLPMRSCDDNGALVGTALLANYVELLKRRQAEPNKQFVLNLSLGGTAPSDTPDPNNLAPDEQALMNLAKNGVVISAAMDNNFETGNTPGTPDYLTQLTPNIIAVAAVGPNGTHAAYSGSQKYVDIAAPGGDSTQGKTILSTMPVANGSYGLMEGCSMAAPQVAGAVALLLSVPGVKPDDCKGILRGTARPVPGATVPSNMYGYGVMDVYEALLKVAVGVTVVEPDGTGGKASQGGNVHIPDPVETLRPTLRFAVNQITPGNLTITLNGQALTNWTPANVSLTMKDQNGVDVPLIYDVVIDGVDMPAGINVVEISGVKPGPPDLVVTDTRKFVIAPYQVPAGRSMISIPYFQENVTPETYFGTTFRLARWMPLEGRYAVYSPALGRDPGASFAPPDVRPVADGEAVPSYPLGVAYWADTESVKPILTRGLPVAAKPFVIPLRGRGSLGIGVNWNMVGNPFPFDVPFNALLVDTPSGRVTIATAVDRGYLLGNLYSYDGATGYTFRTLPDGALLAWHGHWLGVTSVEDIALVVPPAKISRASKTTTVAPAKSCWKLQISATSAGMNDAWNFIGASTSASDGTDVQDVPKPPALSPAVALGIQPQGGRSGEMLAQDVRAAGGSKTWQIMVASDFANSDVTVRWAPVGTLPRNLKLVLADPATGQSVDMRVRSSYTFQAGENPAPRPMTITARMSGSAPMRISNLSVRPSAGRASGAVAVDFTLSTDASCEVRVLGADGRTVNTVSSRAAMSGDVHLVWNGKDGQGRSVPAGTYLMQVRAQGGDGEVVRVIQPFALVR